LFKRFARQHRMQMLVTALDGVLARHRLNPALVPINSTWASVGMPR